jgi:D-alanine-D-alanine ligase
VGQRTHIAILTSGDASHHYTARDSALIALNAVDALGHVPVLVPIDKHLKQALAASDARIAIPAARDLRFADGSMHDVCADLGVTCIGPPSNAWRACIDKAIASALITQAAGATPSRRVITSSAAVMLNLAEVLPSVFVALGRDVHIKPLRGFGGMGVRHVTDGSHFAHAVLSALKYDDAVVVEETIVGAEHTVLVTGSAHEPWAVGIADVQTGDDRTVSSACTRSFTPARPSRSARQSLVRAARNAARAVGAEELCTVDIILDAAGVAWVIDVDTEVDWASGGRLAACLAAADCAETDLVATLLTDATTAVLAAA